MAFLDSIKSKLTGANSVVIMDQGVVSGSNFLFTIMLAQGLSPMDFGSYALLWLMLLFASSIQQALIVSPMLSLLPAMKPPDRKLAVRANAVIAIGYSLVSALLMLLAVLFFGGWLSLEKLSGFTWAIPVLSLAYLLQDFTRKVLLVIDKARLTFVMDVISYALLLSVVASCWWLAELTLPLVIIFFSLSMGIPSLFFLLRYILVQAEKFSRVKETWQKNWKYSRWLVLTAVLQLFSGNFFIITAAAMLGPLALGGIRIVQNVMGLINVVFLALENFVPMQAARHYYQEGKSRMFRYLGTITMQFGLWFGLMLLLIFFFASPLIEMVYGSQYLPFSSLLQGFTILYVINYTGLPLRFAVRTLSQNQWIFMAYVASVIVSAALATPFIQHFGVMGVAYGMVSAQVVLNTTLFISLLPKRNLKWISFTSS